MEEKFGCFKFNLWRYIMEYCKHYWKGGENATWEVSPNFPKMVKEYIKRHYDKLERSQPETQKIDGYKTTLTYNNTHDKYGRRIVEITGTVKLSRFQKIINLLTRR
jgi:hypothetical protein